jgi:D-cysteine desulfhydrase
MGGLIQMIRSGEIGKGDRVLFWHTGGTPALFADANGLNLARSAGKKLPQTRR